MQCLVRPTSAVRTAGVTWALLVLSFLVAPRAAAQLGQLISPGPLTKAHANLEGIANCNKCHEEGKKVSAARCLACHQAVAERIAAKKGVHRNAGNECVSCHVEHMGRNAELRPFDERHFDHLAETGFGLEGKHAALACSQCHKTRSFLGLSSACATCHADPHKGKLGSDCARCHSVNIRFKDTVRLFDHATTAFPLDGAHKNVACDKCHANQTFTGLEFALCTDCHRNPHRASFGTNCTTCHTTATWQVQHFDHAVTGTPLTGRHLTVPCAQCHVRPAMQVKLRMTPCAGCHRDPHRGEFRQDCAACHTTAGFQTAAFDHAAKTGFPLQGRHAAIPCSECHKGVATPRRGAEVRRVDFRGLRTDCVSCHKDIHRGQLGTQCQSCHTTAATFRLTTFTHPRFPDFYAGQHANLRCDRCHGTGPVATRIYKNLSTNCVSCHKDIHLGQLPQCASCHTVSAPKFAAILFNHDTAAFRLDGKHRAVPCSGCHKSETAVFPAGPGSAIRFRGLPSTCSSCHKDVHLGQLGSNCAQCHTTATFAVVRYTHKHLPPAFFRGRHASLGCADCHKQTTGDFPAGHGVAVKFTGIGDNCSACHRDAHQGQLGASCSSCHSVELAWNNPSRAFHKAGQFPLEGAHLLVPCASCHWNGVIKGTPHTCYDCHWVRRQDDLYQTRLGSQCEMCHRPTAWGDVNWDHAARTGFALSAPHRNLACDQCHKNRVFTAATTACASCHMTDFRNASSPNHVAAGFPTTCETCHRASDVSWNQAHFDHTTFPLLGVHQSQPCNACHSSGIYKGLPTACVSCHKSDYDKSANPNHAAAGFSTSCETCHNFADLTWQQGRYAHLIFPLAGVHSTQACNICHKNNVFLGTPRTCDGCHIASFNSAQNPNHVAAGFPTTCDACHKFTDTTWQQGVFAHTVFSLGGVHAAQPCNACHKNNVFVGTPTTCAGCHISSFNSAQNPNHIAAGFPTTCDTCHKFTDTTWQQGVFTHSIFPLAGVHAAQACSACHQNNVFAGTPTTCAGCHISSFNSAQNPNHIAAGFPTTCDTCHKFTDTSWQQGVFTHSIFPLAGVHAAQACSACHQNNVFAGTPTTCAGCHISSFNSAQNPNHIAAGFPTTCDTCHKFTDASWQQGVFTHSIFPLAGVHAAQACSACHKNNVFAGTPATCAGCHMSSFNSAQNPNHVAAGFPTTCDTCHKFTDTSWQQGVFTHSIFPLAGVHAAQACSACHKNNVFAGTPTSCVGCHLNDYNTAQNPNHIAAGFPTTCDTCHKFTDTSWQQAVFNHTWFPITSGRHAGNPCSACHTDPTNYVVFTCTTCHDRASTDPHHTGVSGYRYDSNACYACHPNGTAGD